MGNDTKLAEPAGPQGAVGTTGTTGTTGAPTPAKNTNGAAKPVSKSKLALHQARLYIILITVTFAGVS